MCSDHGGRHEISCGLWCLVWQTWLFSFTQVGQTHFRGQSSMALLAKLAVAGMQ
jgi:hypothetical protein